MVSEKLNAIIEEIKEEMLELFYEGELQFRKKQLEEIAKKCRLFVPELDDFPVYCSKVLNEAVEQKKVAKLIKEINRLTVKAELLVLFHDRRELLERIAKESRLDVPESTDFSVYCDNVLSEAEKSTNVPTLIEEILNTYPYRRKLQHLFKILQIFQKFEIVMKSEYRQKPLVSTEQLIQSEIVTALVTQVRENAASFQTRPADSPVMPQESLPPEPLIRSEVVIAPTTQVRENAASFQTRPADSPVMPLEPPPTEPTSHTPRQKPNAIVQFKNGVDRIVRFRPRRSTLMTLLLWLPLFIFIIPLILTVLYWNNTTNIFLCIIAIVTAISIMLLCAYNLFFAKEPGARRQRSLTGFFSLGTWCNIIVLVIVITSIPLNAFPAINGLFLKPNSGICDGNCYFDSYRLDSNLKQEAANAFNQNNQKLGCQDLLWAAIGNIPQGTAEQAGQADDARSIALDSTDAEAKIYYADRCTNMPCPCISYVAVVQMAYPADPQYSNDSDYINGVARGNLQGAYVKQNEWNTSHPNGPGMYIFVANIVAGYSNQTYATQTQDAVAQRIEDLQKNDQTHHILGVIGFPSGSDELETKLNDAGIPMVSTTSMPANDATQWPHLFSVVPSLDDEIQDILDYCNQSNFNKILYYYNYQDYYSSNLFNDIWVNIINSDQKYTSLKAKITSIPYDSPNDPSNWSLPAQAASSGSDLVIFIGPMNDTVNFLTKLRQEEKLDSISEQQVLSDDNAYQWVYKYFGPDPDGRASRAAFDDVYFISFAYPDLSAITSHANEQSMLSDFNSLFDPGNRHSGNIYTHQRASSDAILAYDALSILVTAKDDLNKTAPPSLNDLQQYISSHTFSGVSGQITYKRGNLPDQKIVLLISVTQQKNAVNQTLSGQY